MKSLPFPVRELAAGRYEATVTFRQVGEHAAVCYAQDGGLVAVTGPAGERLSEQYARLFVAAPVLYQALADLLDQIERAAANGVDLSGHVGVGDAFAALRLARGEP